MILTLLLALAQPVTTHVRDSYPSLSPDGQTLVFQSSRLGSQALWLADSEGKNPRFLFDGGKLGSSPSTPVWSPDGQKIAFSMRPSGATDANEIEIYVMRRDGTAIRRLTNAPGDDSHPHWTADGARIFFNSARATPDLRADWWLQWHDIYSMAADGTDIKKHTDCRSVCTYPVPSPDSRWIAHRKAVKGLGLDWALEPDIANSEVYVTAVDGSESRNVSKSAAYDGWPMWSPNGRWIVFSSNRDKVPSTGQIYAVRPDGSDLRRLSSGRMSHAQPSFAPDGSRILLYELIETSDSELGHIASIPADLPE